MKSRISLLKFGSTILRGLGYQSLYGLSLTLICVEAEFFFFFCSDVLCSHTMHRSDCSCRKATGNGDCVDYVMVSKFNGSHFGLPPSEIQRMTGQVAIINLACVNYGVFAQAPSLI